jgi:hypothetical protein
MNEAVWLPVLNTAGTELPPRSRITTNNLAVAALVPSKATVAAVFFLVSPSDVAPEVAAIDLSFLAFAANNAALHFLRHRFPEFGSFLHGEILSLVWERKTAAAYRAIQGVDRKSSRNARN